MTAARTKRPAANSVRAWEDDPMSEGATPIERPVPKFPKARMKLVFDVAQPAAGLYDPGTPEFRWWTAAEALSRAVAFWQPLLAKATTWQRGTVLNVRLDAGDKLNAFYNRDSLTFFHATVKGRTIYSGESPDVATHECGHAILDAIRPELWGAMSHEIAALHESFGDMSALLTALQLPSVRDMVLAETGGILNRTSRLSRVAEQFGWAVRQRTPCAADPDCLRNAVNCFFYQPPEQLPILGPAAILSSEPHSYSRVFTAAFFLTLTGMVITLGPPSSDVLLEASQDAGRLLAAAVRAAPMAPNYMSQVAAAFVAADKQLFDGKYLDAIANGFVGKGLLTESAVEAASTPPVARIMAASPVPQAGPSILTFPGQDFGFDRPIVCEAPADAQQFAVAAVANDGGALRPASAEATARGFLRELLVRNHITRPGRDPGDRIQTHELVEDGGALRIVRRLFDAAVRWPGDGEDT
jgi:hypothetical protein